MKCGETENWTIVQLMKPVDTIFSEIAQMSPWAIINPSTISFCSGAWSRQSKISNHTLKCSNYHMWQDGLSIIKASSLTCAKECNKKGFPSKTWVEEIASILATIVNWLSKSVMSSVQLYSWWNLSIQCSQGVQMSQWPNINPSTISTDSGYQYKEFSI